MRIFGEKLIKENNISSINEIYKYSHKMYNQYFYVALHHERIVLCLARLLLYKI